MLVSNPESPERASVEMMRNVEIATLPPGTFVNLTSTEYADLSYCLRIPSPGKFSVSLVPSPNLNYSRCS